MQVVPPVMGENGKELLTAEEALKKYLSEVRKKLKNETKNELIRVVGALLVDQLLLQEKVRELQVQLQALTTASGGENSEKS